MHARARLSSFGPHRRLLFRLLSLPCANLALSATKLILLPLCRSFSTLALTRQVIIRNPSGSFFYYLSPDEAPSSNVTILRLLRELHQVFTKTIQAPTGPINSFFFFYSYDIF